MRPPVLQRVRNHQERIFAQDGRDLDASDELEGPRRRAGGSRGGVQLHARETCAVGLPGHRGSGRV